MSLSLEGINGAARFLTDTAFKGITLAGEGLCKGVSLAGDGVCWTGRQVVALGPVLQQAASTVADQIIKVATAVASVVSKIFSIAITIAKTVLSAAVTTAQAGYQVGSQFIKNHPRDITVGLGAAAATVVVVLLFQNLFCGSKKTATV